MSSISSKQAHPIPVIACAGIAVIDYVFRVNDFPAHGKKLSAREFSVVSGGCAANAAVAIARLGGKARLAVPLGDDEIKDTILARLRNEAVDCKNVMALPGVTSPISAVFVDAAGERTIVTHRDARIGGARLPNPDSLFNGAQGVLIDNSLREFVLPIAEAARRRGLTVVLDGDKPVEEHDPLLRICSHVIFSKVGLCSAAGCDDLRDALIRVAGKTDAFIAVTDGANGVLWIAEGGVHHMPAFHVQVIDTLGAGDVFHGAFALALAEGQDTAASLRFAAATSAIKCTRFGGIAGAPSRTEVEDFLCREKSRT